MNERIIAPSVLSLDYSKMTEQISILNQSKAKWLHFDVMDGHFVQKHSIMICNAFPHYSRKIMKWVF